MCCGIGWAEQIWTGISKVGLSTLVSKTSGEHNAHDIFQPFHPLSTHPHPQPTHTSPSSLRYVDLRLCSSPVVTRATYEYDTSLLNGHRVARAKRGLSEFLASNSQENRREEVRAKEERKGEREGERGRGRREGGKERGREGEREGGGIHVYYTECYVK